MLQPDMCSDTELVFLQRSGAYSRIYTGVRHENWMNRWKVAPLAGGSAGWARKLRWFNIAGLASTVTGAVLNLMPIWGLVNLSMGTPATLSAVLTMDPILFASLWVLTHSIAGLMYYFQYVNQIVKAIWWEPDTRTVCVELMNFMEMFNLENRAFKARNSPTVIKLPQKFCSHQYDVEVKKGYIQFDLATVSAQ